MKVWVKICGVTRVSDAVAAAEAGADAIGVNFYEGSRRYCPPAAACEIVAAVSPGMTVYGVFVGAARERIAALVAETGVTGVQLHGDEPEDEARGWDLPVIRAVGVGDRDGVADALARAESYRVLLDNPAGGGSGRRFDSDLVGGLDLSQAIVAGGLTAGNVAEVVARLRPFGVDTAGGVESAIGVKDPGKVREFVTNARSS